MLSKCTARLRTWTSTVRILCFHSCLHHFDRHNPAQIISMLFAGEGKKSHLHLHVHCHRPTTEGCTDVWIYTKIRPVYKWSTLLLCNWIRLNYLGNRLLRLLISNGIRSVSNSKTRVNTYHTSKFDLYNGRYYIWIPRLCILCPCNVLHHFRLGNLGDNTLKVDRVH